MRIGDIIGYLRTMERAIVAALAGEGIAAQGGRRAADRRLGEGGAKIASIGVHVSRRVTTHGFAVNAENDLEPFGWIVPCGLEGVTITSIAARDRPRPQPRRLPARAWRRSSRSAFERRGVASRRSS
jgi:lipoyl(octanoyl) transferase